MCGRLHVRAADVTELLFEFLELIIADPIISSCLPGKDLGARERSNGRGHPAANALVVDAELGETTQHPIQYV